MMKFYHHCRVLQVYLCIMFMGLFIHYTDLNFLFIDILFPLILNYKTLLCIMNKVFYTIDTCITTELQKGWFS